MTRAGGERGEAGSSSRNLQEQKEAPQGDGAAARRSRSLGHDDRHNSTEHDHGAGRCLSSPLHFLFHVRSRCVCVCERPVAQRGFLSCANETTIDRLPPSHFLISVNLPDTSTLCGCSSTSSTSRSGFCPVLTSTQQIRPEPRLGPPRGAAQRKGLRSAALSWTLSVNKG